MSPPPLELQAVVLGLVQGVCEFLPISSSAHLVVLPELLGWPYLGKTFDVALHVGTLAALLSHFRDDLQGLGRAAQRLVFSAGQADDPEARLLKLMAVASLPAAVAGFLLEDLVEPYLQGLLPVAVLSIAWGLLLQKADRSNRGELGDLSRLSFRQALLIGSAQAAALLPGTSRSGVTMTAGLLLGLSRPAAARFSFLLSIPVVAGAALFKGWGALKSPMDPGLVPAILLGIAASGWTGRLCLSRFLAYIQRGGFRPFALYRVAFGGALLIWLWINA